MDKDDDEEEDSNAVTVVHLPCMPSLVSLQLMRNRLHLAHIGRKLMGWTAMATGKELRKMAAELAIEYVSFRDTMRDCYILLARARYYFPPLNETVLNNLEEQACITVEKSWKSLTGVKVLKLFTLDNKIDAYPYLGIGIGGITINEAKKAWRELLKLLVFMAQGRVEFEQLEFAHKNATKRHNIISKVVMPRLNVTVKYILTELEEKEREDTFRLKRFKELKMKKKTKDSDDKDKTNKDNEIEVKIEIDNVEICVIKVDSVKEDDVDPIKYPENTCEFCQNKVDPKKICEFCQKIQSHPDVGVEDTETPKSNVKRNVVFSGDSEKQEENIKMVKDLMSHIDNLIDFTKHFDKKGVVAFITGECGQKGESNAAPCDVCHEIMKANDSADVSATQSLEIKTENAPCCIENMLGKDEKVSSEICPAKNKLPPCEACRTKLLASSKVTSETKPSKTTLIRVDVSLCNLCKENVSATENNVCELPETEEDISDDSYSCKVCKENLEAKGSKTSTESKKSCNYNDLNNKPSVSISTKNTNKLPPEEPQSGFDGNELGSFEKQFKEIVRVVRSQNDDGTISEEKKIITIRTERRTPKNFSKLDRKSDSEFTRCSIKSNSNLSCDSTSPNKSSKIEPRAKTSKVNIRCGSSTPGLIITPSGHTKTVTVTVSTSPKKAASVSDCKSCAASKNSKSKPPEPQTTKKGAEAKVCCEPPEPQKTKKGAEAKVCCEPPESQKTKKGAEAKVCCEPPEPQKTKKGAEATVCCEPSEPQKPKKVVDAMVCCELPEPKKNKKDVEAKVCCDATSSEKKPNKKTVSGKSSCKDECISTCNLKQKNKKMVSNTNSCCRSASDSSTQEKDKMVLVSQQDCGCQSVHVIPKSKYDWFENLLKDLNKPMKIEIKDSLKNIKSVLLMPNPCKKTSESSLASCHTDSVCDTNDNVEDKTMDDGRSVNTACSKKILKNQTNSSSVCCPVHPKSRASGITVTFKDASTNTKRSTRFDVRSVRSSPIKSKKNTVHNNCICKSDTDLLINKKRSQWMSK